MEQIEVQHNTTKPKNFIQDDLKNKPGFTIDQQMTSSIISTTSSLTSPVDSGVQLLDSESEITSVMSVSGIGCDIDAVPNLENDEPSENLAKNLTSSAQHETGSSLILADSKKNIEELELKNRHKNAIMTKSDIANQNVMHNDLSMFSSSVPNCSFFDKYFENKLDYHSYKQKESLSKTPSDEVFESPENNFKNSAEPINVSLCDYELLDYTTENGKLNTGELNEMHVSMSEEVKESLVTTDNTTNVTELNDNKTQPTTDEQIVFRRQRKKKSKSDTPKKRVSFHEDILNSTKIDDIHINHGFITHEPDVSISFFQRGFSRKPDVVKGRYSWAAEGDAPYYQKNVSERQVKSDIYIHHARFSSSSSSSSTSISSSLDEDNTEHLDSEKTFVKKEPTQKLPKSSCLKKTKHNKKYINTNIVEEETNMRKKKCDVNLLDTNIFGSLKNLISFSTSVPLAERGVPEGQEDITYSSSHDTIKSNCFSPPKSPKILNNFEVAPAPIKKIGNLNLEFAKTNLKLTRNEGFYPNYPNNQHLPSNIVLCDSNVYEHKGISYSYEYDKFQKTFEQKNKPKSSTIYQMLFKELSFFKRKLKKEVENSDKENFEFINIDAPEPVVKNNEQDITNPKNSLNKYSSTTRMDWSDNETVSSDLTEHTNTRHLDSPKKKINKQNHYSVQSFKFDNSDSKSDTESQSSTSKSLQYLKPSSSKTSLINRFLRNVTMKKMLDIKASKKQKTTNEYLGLYIKGVKPDLNLNEILDRQIEDEIIRAKGSNRCEEKLSSNLMIKFKNEISDNDTEKLLKVFPIRSAYTTFGLSKPLMIILSDTTFYIVGFKPDSTYCKHFVLPYTELNTILIGPNAQTIHLSNYDNNVQCIVTTGCTNITNNIMGQLEMAIRRDKNKPKLPAVKHLNMRDMINLRRSICKQTTVQKDEEYFYYTIVEIQDFNSDVPETPLGPNKEGPLMFKFEYDSRWETAYFILKAGVLYMLSSPSYRVPLRVFPLINGACQGAKRVYQCLRPHTFQLIIEGTTILLAAPDEYVASEWLQALVHAASGTYNHHEKLVAQSCSLLMTCDHILTIREAFPCTINSLLSPSNPHQPIKGPQVLSCATISDIIAFRLPSAEQSWCILEFACREVHESSGDWILYFSTNTELECFISTLEMLWAYHNDSGDSFPLSTIPETDPLNRKCMDTYKFMQNAWANVPLCLQDF